MKVFASIFVALFSATALLSVVKAACSDSFIVIGAGISGLGAA